jgi:tetratricopeptide (TPR) repeat protein
VGFYLEKLVWPSRLVSDYPFPQPFGLTNIDVLGASVVMVGATVAVVLSLRRTRVWLAGGLIFALTILPTLGLIRFTASITTNRSMYLPMVGLLLPLHWELSRLWDEGLGAMRASLARVIAACVGATLAIASAHATRCYESHWQDSLTLLQYYLSQEPDDYRLHTRLGNEWIQRGDHRSAIAEFRAAIRLNPRWTENHLNLGRALFTVGEYSEAAQALATALGQTPNDWRAHMLMGMTEGRLGHPEDALREFQAAARIAPRAAAPHFNIAVVLAQQGKTDQAAEEYRQTLRLDPRFTEARMALAALGASMPDGPAP